MLSLKPRLALCLTGLLTVLIATGCTRLPSDYDAEANYAYTDTGATRIGTLLQQRQESHSGENVFSCSASSWPIPSFNSFFN